MSSTGKASFFETELANPIFFVISFFAEVFVATFESFKNFAIMPAFTRKSNFSFISSRSKMKRILIILASVTVEIGFYCIQRINVITLLLQFLSINKAGK